MGPVRRYWLDWSDDLRLRNDMRCVQSVLLAMLAQLVTPSYHYDYYDFASPASPSYDHYYYGFPPPSTTSFTTTTHTINLTLDRGALKFIHTPIQAESISDPRIHPSAGSGSYDGEYVSVYVEGVDAVVEVV